LYFDIDQLDGRASYKLIASTVVPRPIAWVVTLDDAGRTNAAPFSFFNAMSGAPPVICVGIGNRRRRPKDSLANIRSRGQFVVNLVSEETLPAMNVTAIDFPAEVDELREAQLDAVASVKVAPPRIAQSPVALECRLRQLLEVAGTGHIVVADVVAVHVRDDAVIDAAKCYIDTPRLNLLGRMQSPGGYVRTSDTFRLPQIPLEQWQGRS